MSLTTEKYAVTIQLEQPMLATNAANQSIWAQHIAKSQREALAKEGWTEEAITKELEATIAGLSENDDLKEGLTTFFRSDTYNEDVYRKPEFEGYFVRDYMVKGFFKNAAQQLKTFGALKQLKSKVTNHVFVTPWAIKIADLTEEFVVVERPLRAQTPMGERVCIARSHALPAGRKLSFEVTSVGEVITAGCLKDLLAYGQFMGIGQNRANGYGNFSVVSFETL